MVKSLKLTNFDGENVEKVVSLICGAVNRLENLKTRTGKGSIPSDMPEHLIKVIQTSLVVAFNRLFERFNHLQPLHHVIPMLQMIKQGTLLLQIYHGPLLSI
jgi:hypothetical protein